MSLITKSNLKSASLALQHDKINPAISLGLFFKTEDKRKATLLERSPFTLSLGISMTIAGGSLIPKSRRQDSSNEEMDFSIFGNT